MFDPLTDPAGNYEYRVEFANCLAFSVLTIEMAGPTVINIPNDTTICAGGSINLNLYDLDNGQAPFTYSWDYSGEFISSQQNSSFSPLQSGNACLTVVDDCGYLVTACFAVVVLPGIDVVFSADTTTACYPEVYTLTNMVDPTFYQTSQWEISDGNEINNEDEITIGFEYPGTYSVTLSLTNSLGCAYSATYDNYLVSFAPPIAGYTADPQPTNIEETEIQFTDATQGAEIVEYRWRFFDMSGQQIGASGQPNPTYEFPNDFGGLYNVFLEVTDINGCSDVITPGIIDIDDLLQFYVPTAFTPNNDGVNDVLFFEGADLDPDRFSLKVFNRYGDKVFETVDPTIPWLGDAFGGDYYAPNGAYNWVAVVVSESTGERREISGSVMVIR
jgi:gliding motility-associated-like protein